MDIVRVLDQVRVLLRQEGRLSYRLLKRQFVLDEEALDDLKYELINVQEVAIDKDGQMLVWIGEQEKGETGKRGNGETGEGSGLRTSDPGRMSLAQLWQSHGKKTEAYQLLVEIYNWFTEGFDTADLQDAKAVLEELSQY